MSCCSCDEKEKCKHNKIERSCINCFYDNLFVDYVVTITDPCDTCINGSQFKHLESNE